MLNPVLLDYSIEVGYEKVSETEEYKEYDIFLKGYDDEYIHRINTSDLTFVLNVKT